jgi:hypothetical protein
LNGRQRGPVDPLDAIGLATDGDQYHQCRAGDVRSWLRAPAIAVSFTHRLGVVGSA